MLHHILHSFETFDEPVHIIDCCSAAFCHSPAALVALFSSSVDSAASSLAKLGAGNRIAADSGIFPLLAGYGDQNPLEDNIQTLYYAPTYTPAVAEFAREQQVQYVLADSRLSQQVPPSQNYFPGDPTVVTKKIPLGDLTKFNNVRGIARIFDDGNIVIYNMQALGYVPQ